MKAFGIFNLCLLIIWLVLFGLVVRSGGEIGCIFVVISMGFVLPALAVVDVIWLIVLAVAGRRRRQAQLTGEQQPEGTLTRYMRKAQTHGISHDKVAAHLRLNGWSEAEIQEGPWALVR